VTHPLPDRRLVGPAVPRCLATADPQGLASERTDVLVIGGGVAGLSAAIAAADARDTLVVLKGSRTETATSWAQGGMAAVLGDEDTPDSHVADTLQVAAGLADEDITRLIVEGGPELVDRWLAWGGEFDRAAAGTTSPQGLALAREGGHSVARIIHAHGDQTGAEIQRLLIARAESTAHLRVIDETFVVDLVTDGDAVRGAVVWSAAAGLRVVWAGATILCSGGAGQLYRETSNPPGATGDGVAMAYRAGAALAGMEFVQFHPTVLYIAGMARFLVSETARGEGGRLVDRTGHRFMPDYHPDAELAPRDVVSRAIVRQMAKVRDSNVYLDMRHLDAAHLQTRFPVIWQACAEFGIDMARDLIPVHPACHYLVGGVATDAWARTSLAGLYACGEVASSGIHGANRMGSNSLLEGAVMGRRAGMHAREAAGQPREASDVVAGDGRESAGTLDLHDMDNSLRSLMWRLVGIERDAQGLGAATARLEWWNHVVARRVLETPFGWSTANKLLVGWLIALAARTREESRGTHFRRDFPERDDARWQRRIVVARDDARGRLPASL